MTEPLFTIPLWADLLGVGLGGVQGAMFASGFQGQRRLDWLGVAIIGIMIGMFGAFGTSKAIAFGIPPVPAVFIGVCAAVGGGVLRDMLMGLPTSIMHVGSLYAVAAGAGCVFIATANGLGMSITLAAVLGIVVTAVIRVLAVSFDVSLPEQRRLYRRKVAAETGVIQVVKPSPE